MNINVRFSYTESEIPPRCRKARPVMHHDGEMTVQIPEVTTLEAAVAIVQKSWVQPWNHDLQDFPIEYRLFEGRLWTKFDVMDCLPRPQVRGGTDYSYPMLPDHFDNRWNKPDSRPSDGRGTRLEEMQRIYEKFADFIIIEGQVWRTTGEPRYYVVTLGLGRNHGGTHISLTQGHNSNISNDRYFNLLELNKAADLATGVALDRDDTNSLPFDRVSKFDVLIPEAVKINAAVAVS
jgi:hypothetical protein